MFGYNYLFWGKVGQDHVQQTSKMLKTTTHKLHESRLSGWNCVLVLIPFILFNTNNFYQCTTACEYCFKVDMIIHPVWMIFILFLWYKHVICKQ